MPREQHPVEVYGIEEILEEGMKVKDLNVKELLFSIDITLKKIEYHLSLASDTELKNQDV